MCLLWRLFIAIAGLISTLTCVAIPEVCEQVWNESKYRDRICSTAVFKHEQSKSLCYEDPEVQHQIRVIGTCSRFAEGSDLKACCDAYVAFAETDFDAAMQACKGAQNILQTAYLYNQRGRRLSSGCPFLWRAVVRLAEYVNHLFD